MQLVNPYEQSAWAISEGKRLYEQFNCVGCHAHGGGAIGAAPMDDERVYGSESVNIVPPPPQGRANRMPSQPGRGSDPPARQVAPHRRSLPGRPPSPTRP